MNALNYIDLLEVAQVPQGLIPWGKNQRFNAHYIGPHAFLFDAHSESGMTMLDFPEEGYGGYTVMDDTPREISRHFEAVRHARGRILKTGLGFGCFVRMCLVKPEVEHIDVIEIDPAIATHFGAEFEDNPRVTIHVGDALQTPIHPNMYWDLAWHDIYCDGNINLQLQHTRLITRYLPFCHRQGAWNLPRWVKRYSRII